MGVAHEQQQRVFKVVFYRRFFRVVLVFLVVFVELRSIIGGTSTIETSFIVFGLHDNCFFYP